MYIIYHYTFCGFLLLHLVIISCINCLLVYFYISIYFLYTCDFIISPFWKKTSCFSITENKNKTLFLTSDWNCITEVVALSFFSNLSHPISLPFQQGLFLPSKIIFIINQFAIGFVAQFVMAYRKYLRNGNSFRVHGICCNIWKKTLL